MRFAFSVQHPMKRVDGSQRRWQMVVTVERVDRTLLHRVVDGEPRTVPLAPDELRPGPRRTGWFLNTLEDGPPLRIRQLIESVEGLAEPLPTQMLLRQAGLPLGDKGAAGALRVLDIVGMVHARAGRGRSLIWYPGSACAGRAGAADASLGGRYVEPTRLLSASTNSWFATDFLVRTAGFDPDLPTREDSPAVFDRRLSSLPAAFFHDVGKSGRKYVLGASKTLFWLEFTAWRQYSCQAVEWRWAGPPLTLPKSIVQRQAARPSEDAYLSDAPRLPRDERMRARGLERLVEHLEKRQVWIDDNDPDAAAAYKHRRVLHERRRLEKRRADAEEARSFGAGSSGYRFQ